MSIFKIKISDGSILKKIFTTNIHSLCSDTVTLLIDKTGFGFNETDSSHANITLLWIPVSDTIVIKCNSLKRISIDPKNISRIVGGISGETTIEVKKDSKKLLIKSESFEAEIATIEDVKKESFNVNIGFDNGIVLKNNEQISAMKTNLPKSGILKIDFGKKIIFCLEDDLENSSLKLIYKFDVDFFAMKDKQREIVENKDCKLEELENGTIGKKITYFIEENEEQKKIVFETCTLSYSSKYIEVFFKFASSKGLIFLSKSDAGVLKFSCTLEDSSNNTFGEYSFFLAPKIDQENDDDEEEEKEKEKKVKRKKGTDESNVKNKKKKVEKEEKEEEKEETKKEEEENNENENGEEENNEEEEEGEIKNKNKYEETD